MGLNFRKLLISELERRQREITSLLRLLQQLKMIQEGTPNRIFLLNSGPAPQPSPAEQPSRFTSNADRDQEIGLLRKDGWSLRAIGEEMSLSHAAVWKVLRRLQTSQATHRPPVVKIQPREPASDQKVSRPMQQ